MSWLNWGIENIFDVITEVHNKYMYNNTYPSSYYTLYQPLANISPWAFDHPAIGVLGWYRV